MKRVPVHIQLFFILFLILVIPMVTITYYTTRTMMTYSEEEIAETSMSRMHSNKKLTELTLNNIILDVLKMVKEKRFNQIKDISYEVLNSEYETISEAMNLKNRLNEIVYSDDTVYSVFYYMDDADYVFSTNKGIVRTENFEDMSWLLDVNYTGVGGVWYPRILNTAAITEIKNETNYSDNIPVISFVYRLSRLTTSVRGTIVINVYEKKLLEFLNMDSENYSTVGYIIDSTGKIVAHGDKSLLYKDVSGETFIHDIINSDASHGYKYVNYNNERVLYTYAKSSFSDWIFVNTYSMDSLMEKTTQVTTNYLILTTIIIAVGIISTIIISTKFSKPVRELVKRMQNQMDINIQSTKNEWAYLSDAFEKIKEDEKELHTMLRNKAKETKSLAILNLLADEISNESELEELNKIFPYSHFMVTLVSIDNYEKYSSTTNLELRRYRRFLLIDLYEKAFPPEYRVCAAKYEPGITAIIINFEHFDQKKVTRTLSNILTGLKDEAYKVYETTVTIGISGVHTGYSGVKECVFEAFEALKQRLIRGKNTMIFWAPAKLELKKLHYSYNSEKKIINYLITSDIEAIKEELRSIVTKIKEADTITNDNILFIFNQLIGATMKYMVEHNINTSQILKSNVNIYSVITNMDTIDEIEASLIELFTSIIEYTAPTDEVKELTYLEKVMLYMKEHYSEDLIFEDVAREIGISYSYLRKLIKDETGKSLIDNLNIIRIEEVKRLLLQTDLTISEIATEVGYRNIQSINRFFKKYEGISPSEFKSLKKHY